MERVNAVLKDSLYQNCIQKIETAEKDRLFCRHDVTHFLDVARISLILSKEREAKISEELIYAAALLHDIGRFAEYEEGTPHEEASAKIAPGILKKCGFCEEETLVIVSAIQHHRTNSVAGKCDLSGILYDADKMSRPCFACKQETKCNWSDIKKNLTLKR